MYRLSIQHPSFYQGRQKHKRHYFEGWYFKQVTADGSTTVALIPGVSYTPTDAHAFIQVLISPTHDMHYVRFPIEQFVYALDDFSFSIGANQFSTKGVRLAIETDELSLHGHLEFGPFTPIRSSWLSPTIMGPLAYLPAMECIHGIVSMHHDVTGHLTYQGQRIEFQPGSGYIEKDWGRSFPSAYTWIHSNHFDHKTVSLVASVATIPYLGLRFTGFFVNLHINEQEYRFATYTGARMKRVEATAHQRTFEFRQGRLRLVVIAHLVENRSSRLAAPKDGAMTKGIKEGLTGEVEIQLYKNNALLYHGTGRYAGIEFVDQLLD
jgi:tocopherol cyclase